MINLFDITSPNIIHCGAGTFSKTAEETSRLGTRAAIVTGGHLHGSERINQLVQDLHNRGISTFIPEPITGEPTVDMVDDLAEFAKGNDADVIVAIGGGSVLDTAKAAAVMVRNEGKTEDYQLKRREIVNPPIAQVAIPTTAGTGSEVTRVSVLTNTAIGVKRSISHPLMTPNAAVLDPELTASSPNYLTTLTAMDAFAHAIESAVSKNANAYTRGIALMAIEQASKGLPLCQHNLNDLDARLMCLMGACFAGLAMQAGLGASHSLAPAICIVGGMRHSEAVAALLPNVIRLNERAIPGQYDEVKRAMDCSDIASRLEELQTAGGFTGKLKNYGLNASDWDEIRNAMNRYASHRQTNPVEVTDDYARELFEMSL